TLPHRPSFPTRRSSDLLVAEGAAGSVEPNSIFRHCSDSLSNERGVVHPLADRIAVEPLFSHFVAYLYAAIDHFGKLATVRPDVRSEEHTSELQSRGHLV